MRALILHDGIHYEVEMVWRDKVEPPRTQLTPGWDLVSCSPKPPDNWVLAVLFARACSMAAAVVQTIRAKP